MSNFHVMAFWHIYTAVLKLWWNLTALLTSTTFSRDVGQNKQIAKQDKHEELQRFIGIGQSTDYLHQDINFKVLPSPYRRISFFHHKNFNLFLFMKRHCKSFNLVCSCTTNEGYYFSRSKKNIWTPYIKLMLLILICILLNIIKPQIIKS